MKNLAFDSHDLRNWQEDMKNMQPGPMAATPFLALAEVVSLTMGETPTGLVIRLARKRGETIDIFLNPAVAEALRGAILAGGQMAGWMRPDGKVISPPRAK